MTTRHSRAQRPATQADVEPTSMTELACDMANVWDHALASGMACYESWLKIASTPFNAALGFDPSKAFADGERRTAVLPWVPKLEAQVIPFRRATDPPGAEGSRITMRMAMPAMFGASAFSIDTLVPLPKPEAETGAQEAGAQEVHSAAA